MNRRGFIGRLAAGVAAAVLTKKAISQTPPQPEAIGGYCVGTRPVQFFSADGYNENERIWHGWSGELVEPPFVFDRVLNQREIAQIHEYYSEKYGIVISNG